MTTLREDALALYTPPFKFLHGYVFDSSNRMVADQGGISGDNTVEGAVALQIRGWGRIGYMPHAKQLQDEIGAIVVDALNAYYEPQGAQQVAVPCEPIAWLKFARKKPAVTSLSFTSDLTLGEKAHGFVSTPLCHCHPAQQVAVPDVQWGVDWGSHGDRSCVSIVKKHPDGTLEVVAAEYEPQRGAKL